MSNVLGQTQELDSLKDELDKISIEQLHRVILQFSNNCYESKKLCATVLVSASVLITVITRGQLDNSFFVGGFIVTFLFWFLDSYNYFYQEKLRIEMKKRMKEISARHNLDLFMTDVGVPLNKERQRRNAFSRVIKSIFNLSMCFYMLILLLDLLLGILYTTNTIRSMPLNKVL